MGNFDLVDKKYIALEDRGLVQRFARDALRPRNETERVIVVDITTLKLEEKNGWYIVWSFTRSK